MVDPHLDEESSVSTSDSTLRQFAALCLLFFGGIAAWQYFVRERETLGLILAGVAVVLGLGGLIFPRGIRPVFVTAMAITFPIGLVVSKLLMGLMYFGVFTPVALFFRLIGRDALQRRQDPAQTTYWAVKPAPRNIRSYFRQS